MAGLLFSGGKDSALAALLLDAVTDVRLVCASFGVTDDYEHAVAAGERLGFETASLDLDRAVAERAVETMVADGYPRAGIQQVHEHALARVAERFDVVADGTRRDDRVPSVDRSLAQHVEDTHGVEYVRPLAGFGRGAVDSLAARHLDVATGPSADLPAGDYETELRALLAATHGEGAVDRIFPEHTQSRVRGREVGSDL
jgi:hypothetical protein